MRRADTDDEPVSLAIAPDKVCFAIAKARQFDVKDAPAFSDPGSNPTDDDEIAILEDRPDDPVVAELTGFIDALNEDEQVDLVALTWLGRGDFGREDWESARTDAAAAAATGAANPPADAGQAQADQSRPAAGRAA